MDLLKDFFKKCDVRLFRADPLREKDPVHQLPESGKPELFLLGDNSPVGDHMLLHLSPQLPDNIQTVVPVNDRVAQPELILFVEPGCPFGVDADLRKELPVSSGQHFRSGDLPPFQPLPEAVIDHGVAGQHGIGAFAEAELPEQRPHCGCFRRVKIQQRSVHIPQNYFDHDSVPPCENNR